MTDRVRLFGMEIDRLTLGDAVARLSGWLADATRPCRYVVTPNVDHAVLVQHHTGLRAAYQDASLVVADGMPVVWASRLLRRPLPERVTGSDLVPALYASASPESPLRTYLLGAMPGVAERAAKNITQRWPSVEVVGTYSPPFGFEKDAAENERILQKIASVRPDVLIIGVGAPKQELWVHAHRERIDASLAICAGATIDFLAGEKRRAPSWMRRTGLEWLHRCATEPRRLLKRYLRDAAVFPGLLWREWRCHTSP
jgi:N-acetylglucosaminyldiphosphoundecaprenol N-acetyl-beta-D-mannosaminyltransferase